MRALGSCVVLVSLLGAPVCLGRAEELTLQDGQKIRGVVVGFENGMFRVETEFGFALVRKDKVKSINFSGPAKADDGKNSPAAASPFAASSDATLLPASKRLMESGAGSTPAPPVAKPSPPPPPASRPLDEPLPSEIREHLEGNNYVNDTFHFAFYKPPGWLIHENAARETGRAIAAIGPEDERTVLFVDLQVWSGEPNLRSDSTDANLRRTYQNYRATSEAATQLDGRPAIRREFEGELDGSEWKGISVRVAQGNAVFGLVGLTSAETLQFHLALLGKIINSFRFLPAGSATSANR